MAIAIRPALRWLGLGLVVAVVTAPAVAAGRASSGPTPPTLEEILSLHSFGATTWSPDGRRLAFVVNHPDTAENTTQAEIWLWEAGADSARRLTRHPRPDLSPTFSPSGDTLAFISTRGGGDPKPAIWMMSLRGGDPWSFGTFEEGLSEVQWSPDGHYLAYVETDTLPKRVAEWRKKRWDPTVENERLQYPRLWTIEVATGKKRLLTPGAQYVWYVRWSPDSKRLACLTSPTGRPDDANRNDIAILSPDGGAPRTLGVIGAAFTWSPDSRWIAWAAGADTAMQVQKTELWIAPADTRGRAVALTQSFDGEAVTPSWSAGSDTLWFHAPIGVSSVLASVAVRSRHVTLTEDRRALAGGITASRQGRVAWVQSRSDMPDELYIADHPRHPGRAVTRLHAGFAKRTCSLPETVRWTSDDGRTVEGLLYRPPTGARPKAVPPMLVQLHGGPYGDRATLGFETWPQYFASQGYQVFIPNFRSSGGYGTAFMMRKRSDWGQQDWRDIQSGIDTLVRRGIADEKKLGVFGRSYGGYLSAWAITQTTRFDACVTIATIVDLPALFGQSDVKKYRAYEFEGFPWVTPENWKRSSPMTHIRNVRTPTLIVGFDDDARTPLAQARQLHAALEALDVPTAFVHYPREPHVPREYRHRLDMFLRMKAWFDRWIR